MNRRTRLLALFLVIFLSGCGLPKEQLVKVQEFGTATAAVGDFGEKEFVDIRNGIIDMNQELLTIDNSKTISNLPIEKPVSVQDTAKRVAASKALKIYGSLLVKLSTKSDNKSLQQTASSLIVNTETALGDDMPDEKRDALAGAIAKVGSLWVAKKKSDALREIVLLYQARVERLVNLLEADFSIKEKAHGYLAAYMVTAERLENAAGKLLASGNSYSALERERAVHAIVISRSAKTHAGELSRSASNALDGLDRANLALAHAVNDSEYQHGDIDAYAKQVQELVNIVEVLSK